MARKMPLDGYWEEGYHYYLEIKGKKAVLRGYDKKIVFTTSIKYDAEKVEAGETAEITLGETVLSRTYKGEPMTWIREMRYENGVIVMEYTYTIMGDTTYTLKRTEHDPFYNMIVRDREILPKIQGLWLQWYKNGKNEAGYGLRIRGRTLRYGTKDHDFFKVKFHAVSYRNGSDVFLCPESLTSTEFPGMTQIDVKENMLTSYDIVCDASVPLNVFLRKEDMGKVAVPPAAYAEIRSTMMCEDTPTPGCDG